MNKLKYELTVLVVLAAAGTMYNNKEIAEGIKKGMALCSDSVIPSLFIFTIICIFMVSAELLKNNKIVDFISLIIFGTKGEIGAITLLSLVSGYPVGGALINELYLSRKINRESAQKMLCYCINAGPAFVIGIIGNKLYNSHEIGTIILISSLFSAIISARILNTKTSTLPSTLVTNGEVDYIGTFIRAVNVSVKNMAAVCGWVLVSSAIIEVISKAKSLKFIGCLLEVTAGTVTAAQNYSIYFVAFLVGFGGISVHLQAMSAAKDILPSYPKIFLWKTLQGALTALFTYILLKIFPQYLSVSNSIKAFNPTASEGNVFTAAVTIIFIMCTIIFANQKINKGRKL